jgi:hypothetical protein
VTPAKCLPGCCQLTMMRMVPAAARDQRQIGVNDTFVMAVTPASAAELPAVTLTTSGLPTPCSAAQVQAAAQEYQREFAAKDTAIQALNGEVEALQDLLHSQLEDARTAARVRINVAPQALCFMKTARWRGCRTCCTRSWRTRGPLPGW